MSQRRIPGINLTIRRSYGGSEVKGQRKIKRPFSPKKFLHVVFRSDKAKNSLSMLNKRSEIELILLNLSNAYEITIEQYTNARSHLHLLLRAPSRQKLQNFLKSFARSVAQMMVGLNNKFWTSLVYSRMVEWGKDCKAVVTYIVRNYLEVLRLMPYQRNKPGGLVLLE